MGITKLVRTAGMVFASYVCGAAWLILVLGLASLFFGALWKNEIVGLLFALIVAVMGFFGASRIYVSLRTNRRSLASGFLAFSLVFLGLMAYFVKNPEKFQNLQTFLQLKSGRK